MKKYFLLLLLVVINGCSLFGGPKYTKPQVNVSSQWPAKDPGTQINDKVNLPDLAWWQEFNDPILNQLIQVSLQRNNQVQIALANLAYAQGQLKQIQLNWLPNISVLGGYSAFPALGSMGYFFGLMPSYTMNVFQQIKQQQQAKYMVEASDYAKDSARLTVIGQVAGSYFTLAAVTYELQLYEKLLADMNEQLKLYQSQFNSGLISMTEVDNQLSQIKQIKAQINLIKHNIVVAQNALRFLANENPGPINLITSFTNLDSNKIIPGNLPLTVLNNRPDVQQAEMVLKAANANIGIAYSQLLPTMNLATFYTDSAPNLTVAGKPNAINQAYTNIPILNAPAFGQIAASNASFKAAYYAYIQTIRGVLRDVDNDLSAHSRYSKQLGDNLLAMSNLKDSCVLAQSRYNNGISSYLDVVNCQVQMDYLALAINQSKLNKFMTIVALYQDLGGGYKANVAK